MANMIELVVKVPEKDWEFLKASNGCRWSRTIIESVINGTPLPKGHGRLKDVDKIINDGISKEFCDWYDEMKYADTIIDADKEDK